jgi:hypothetical protein
VTVEVVLMVEVRVRSRPWLKMCVFIWWLLPVGAEATNGGGVRRHC